MNESTTPVIIAALRTPVCRANGKLRTLRAEQLLAPVLRGLLDSTGVRHGDVNDVVIGNAVGGGGNVARFAALEAGLPVSVPGITVDRQCGSGLDAIALASRLVAAGGDGIYLAGGVESISTAPLRAHRDESGEPLFYDRARFVPPAFGDPDMGVAADTVAAEYRVSRQRQDEFALLSHQRALEAAAAGRFSDEIVPLQTPGGPVKSDDGPRPSLNASVMARFPPAFVSDGSVTAGNSCFDADAAAAVVITSLGRARSLGAAEGLVVLGTETTGVDPTLLGIGAAEASRRLLDRHGLEPGALDLVEFNEAFASQTLACLDALDLRPERVNRDGGALALGHAYGASGAVLVTRLLAQARQRSLENDGDSALNMASSPRGMRFEDIGQLAMAMISIAGGMGTSMLFRYASLDA